MAKPANHVRPLPSCLTAPLTADEASTIVVASELIRHEMKAIHGGKWSAHIDHEAGFVLIRAHGELRAGGQRHGEGSK